LEWETGTLKLRQRDVGKLSARVVLMNSPAHVVCICICTYISVPQCIYVCVSESAAVSVSVAATVV